ncbi:MAG: hypothetical protein F9K31_13285, partial [Dokdonella sp.]
GERGAPAARVGAGRDRPGRTPAGRAPRCRGRAGRTARAGRGPRLAAARAGRRTRAVAHRRRHRRPCAARPVLSQLSAPARATAAASR